MSLDRSSGSGANQDCRFDLGFHAGRGSNNEPRDAGGRCWPSAPAVSSAAGAGLPCDVGRKWKGSGDSVSYDAATLHEPEEPRRCRGTTADGEPCRVGPELVLASGFCFSHDAARRSELKAAGTLAGIKSANQRRKGLDPARIGELKTPSDAMRITALLTVASATGELPAPQARAALVAVQAWLKAFDMEELEHRLADLERERGQG